MTHRGISCYKPLVAASVFTFDNYSAYLKAVVQLRVSRAKRSATYTSWAKRLKYRSPRGIAMVVRGERIPSADMIQRISTSLAHTELEHLYFGKLVELEKTRRGGGDTGDVERQLRHLNPNVDKAQGISLTEFSLIGKWYFFVVKQLVDTPGFRENYEWIASRLRKKLSVVEVRMALRVLTELGLVKRNAKTARLETTKKSISTPSDIASHTLREHHRQMACRGIEALDEQDVTNREFIGVTLRVSPASLPKAKEALRQFMIQFDKKFEDLSSDKIFQLNLQFFEHTGTNEKENEK